MVLTPNFWVLMTICETVGKGNGIEAKNFAAFAGKFGNPGEEDEETDDSWNLFWKHYQIQRNHGRNCCWPSNMFRKLVHVVADSSHHFHHRHFPWQDRQGTLQPSLVSTAPTTESSTISIQSEVPLIDIRSDANGAK